MTETLFDTATDLTRIRIEQARLLKERANGSAFIVQVFISIYTALIGAVISWQSALIWFALSTTLVIVTLIYAKLKSPHGITEDDYKSYLNGHTLICAATGCVWGGYAIYIFEWPSTWNFIIACMLPLTITIGGMMPSSAYRRGYLALAIFALLPIAIYMMLTFSGSARLFGLGTLAYFCTGLMTSAQAEINTRDGIIARANQTFTKNLIEKTAEVERAIEEKSRFLAGTSHDFAQPLHAQGYYIQALSRCVTTQEQKDILTKINNSWRAQHDLLQALSEIARLDNGAIIPNMKPFNLRSLIEPIISEFAPMAEQKNIDLLLSLEDIYAYSDPLLLSRIIRNLLDNALKFTSHGGTVTLLGAEQNGQVKLSITDTGPGLTAEEQALIFDEYYTLANGSTGAGLGSGSGLGLSLVKRFCALLELPLNVQSAKDAGSTFQITLPSPQTEQITTSVNLGPDAEISETHLIVIVDDNSAIREAMAAELTSWGQMVMCARSGDEAVELLSETYATPSLLIIDKRLNHREDGQPEDGMDVISQLRAEVNEDTAAILMTGDIAGFDAVKMAENVHIMLKPVLPAELKQHIQQIILAAR